MHQILAYLFLIYTSTVSAQTDLKTLRWSLDNVRSDEEYAKSLFEQCSNSTLSNVEFGYLGVIESMLAEHTYNPIKKLGYFNSGKEKLEEAIEKAPENIELRFLRLMIQVNVPFFLEYRDKIEEDKTLIMKGIISNENQYSEKFVNRMIKILEESELCTNEELKQLKGE